MEYREGSTILLYGEKIIVTEKDEDIKNGEPGFQGRKENGQMIWNYDSEIDSVVIY